MCAGIEAIAHALPTKRISSQEIADAHGFELGFITQKLGISERRILKDDESVSGLATSAVDKLLREAGVAKDEIDILLVVSQTPDYCLPHVSAIVHGSLGLSPDVLAMDLSLGCSGYVYGLATISSLMQTHSFTKGVLVTADAYSRVVDPTDRNTAPLFGDAATATLLSPNPRYQVGATTFGTNGALHESLIVHGSGSTLEPRESLRMDGRSIFNFAMRIVPNDVKRCLELNALEIDDIDKFVFHQANAFMLESLRQRMGIEGAKVVVNLREVGNTTSSSIPLALEPILCAGSEQPHHILLSGFGVGLSWASTVVSRTADVRGETK